VEWELMLGIIKKRRFEEIFIIKKALKLNFLASISYFVKPH
jgi:hypothetical protein